MQDTLKEIFDMALRDCPEKLFRFSGEEYIIFYGFRISRKGNVYEWKDARYNDYFEPVDPIITEKILELGFKECILKIVQHTNQERIVKLNRDLMEIDAEINHWTSLSSKAYNDMKKALSEAEADPEKVADITKRFESKKKSFAKKRGVLKIEREALMADIKFYQSRIKLYEPN
jgi:hypothetical protein